MADYNLSYLLYLYDRYVQDPASLDPAWQSYFAELAETPEALDNERKYHPQIALPQLPDEFEYGAPALLPHEITGQHWQSVYTLLDAYRRFGHMYANLDPLDLAQPQKPPELTLEHYALPEDILSQRLTIGNRPQTVAQCCQHLEAIYCDTIGAEYMHIEETQERQWLQDALEQEESYRIFTAADQKHYLSLLQRGALLESFLHKKFPGAKRFSIEGAESVLVGLDACLTQLGQYGLTHATIAMAHRGRLSIMAHILGKPIDAILAAFQGDATYYQGLPGSGDVKYHMGYENIQTFGKYKIHLAMPSNPSHLESINGVAMGIVRAQQHQTTSQDHHVALLIHGDASIAGQGSVAEAFTLSYLKGYHIGGTIHWVTNNQIGFTADTFEGRSSRYCTDIAKMIQAPVLHVNGHDPEAVATCARLAAAYRHTFHKDIIIDVICYRKYGHNEIDDPTFTQPQMYSKVKSQQPVKDLYSKRLRDAGILSSQAAIQQEEDFTSSLQPLLEQSLHYTPPKTPLLEKGLNNLKHSKAREKPTGVTKKLLMEIGSTLTTIPKDFAIHPRLQRLLEEKQSRLAELSNIDWATAEALAIGTLLKEEVSVRLIGQDSGRGTFSQRHAIWVDQASNKEYIPLADLAQGSSTLEIYNSPLSEMAAMGFEYGYSLQDPSTLVLWEAQFGDFSNGAQVIIDQYLSSGETKWLALSALTLLLPHGHEGQGPEHSSARLERFLQLSAEDNWRVVNCSTPANYFHALRRQVYHPAIKPLIVMTPKYLLRHKLAVSSFEEMATGTDFAPIIQDPEVAIKKGATVIFCTGKIFYDLYEARQENKDKSCSLIRLEQLAPFPYDVLLKLFKQIKPKDLRFVWCQEEPQNMGAWTFIKPYIEQILQKLKFDFPTLQYAGRPVAASPATGYGEVHLQEQKQLVAEALGLT